MITAILLIEGCIAATLQQDWQYCCNITNFAK